MKSPNGQVIKADRTIGKDSNATAYARHQTEKYNNLTFKQGYQEARKTGNKYFAYKGKVYKTDLANGKDNITERMKLYGNNLGYSKSPKLQNKQSRAAREQYRKDLNTSEIGHIEEHKKSEVPYASSYDGGELFANFMGLASPTRWVGAIGRASRGEGNTGTYVGRVLNNMLDPQNGARENQGVFSIGLSQNDEQWAKEHPVVSGITNGVLDAAAFGPKPRFTKATEFKPNYGWIGRKFTTEKVEVPMGIYEGNLNLPVGAAVGKRPFVELGEPISTYTKTVTRRKMSEPGTKYVKFVTERPTGKYDFSWTDGAMDMMPWITATTSNATMKKQGGLLISRNPVTRFKNRKK